MRALVYDDVGGPVELREVADPTPPDGGVVVEVRATGLCRSDWHAWAGHEAVPLPNVPGHELAGVVAEVGTGVRRWRVGDRVTVPFVEGCGQCRWCAEGNAQVCPDQRQPGFTHPGSFAEKVALYAADTNLVALPDGVGFAAAASLGCRFATAHRALVARAVVRPGEWVVVVGAGGVGLSTVMIGAALGARVIAVDPNPAAGELAVSLGAAAALVPDADLQERVVELTDGGAQVAVDAVGSEAAAATAIGSLRRRGRHVQVGLLPPTPQHPRIPMDRVIGWELDVFGSHGMAAADYPAMLELVSAGILQPERLLERTISLAEAAELLPRLDSATPTGITVIDPTAIDPLAPRAQMP
ncbi:alcohol dehydrogenase [Enemella evansiae]|uniref:alcohol dehydrogenase catalytic domain-containing protein n=1 Tax=Enemella evansiae TaxID=2016499 RepID=UPI000B97AC3A|nr:alcohol dehydrogenase catalytic domain-containing protein [Enemella evansiae]OYO10872.1 alcohol dehydrogenase [Enemella evansiae]